MRHILVSVGATDGLMSNTEASIDLTEASLSKTDLFMLNTEAFPVEKELKVFSGNLSIAPVLLLLYVLLNLFTALIALY
jgi:hypothetical protein